MSFKKLFLIIKPEFFLLIHVITVLILSSGLASAETTKFKSWKTTTVSDQKFNELGKAFASGLNNKDVHTLSQIFDMKGFAYKTANTVFDSKKDIEGFVKGFTRHKPENFLNQIFSVVFKGNANVKFLRVLKGNRPLIRVDYQDSGHEYIILHAKIKADKKLTVIDMFLLSSGKKLSTTLGAASQLMIQPNKSILNKLFGGVEINEEILDTFKKLSHLRKNNQYKEAYKLLESLPDAVKNNRVMIDSAVQLSQFINDEEYRKQLTRLDKYFGKDKTTAFILIDHYYFTKNYKKALASIDRLIDSYGVDAALLNLKASTFHMENNNTKARIYANKAIKLEPQFQDAYWTLASILTADEEFSELIRVLSQIETKFGYAFTVENFTGNKFYKKFHCCPVNFHSSAI